MRHRAVTHPFAGHAVNGNRTRKPKTEGRIPIAERSQSK
jgi:hypothetical protein